jgi:hypothetical protein
MPSIHWTQARVPVPHHMRAMIGLAPASASGHFPIESLFRSGGFTPPFSRRPHAAYDRPCARVQKQSFPDVVSRRRAKYAHLRTTFCAYKSAGWRRASTMASASPLPKLKSACNLETTLWFLTANAWIHDSSGMLFHADRIHRSYSS